MENFEVEQYDDIVLSEAERRNAIDLYKRRVKKYMLEAAEISEAYRLQRERKHGAIWQAAYWQKVKEESEIKSMNALQLFDFIKQRLYMNGQELIVDSENEKIIEGLCLYFSNDKRFEKIEPGFSLKKGILLYGNVGCGKTYLMKAFRVNPKFSYVMYSAQSIAIEFSIEGWPTAEKYSRLLELKNKVFGQTVAGICIDDLGMEGSKKHYGESDVILHILDNRYKKDIIPFSATHVTMNLTGDEIEEMYGIRIRDRMREMFNVLSFSPNASSRR